MRTSKRTRAGFHRRAYEMAKPDDSAGPAGIALADLPGFISKLKKAGLRFRNEMESGPGGRQIQIEDPDGNPIELFEPVR